MRYLIMILLIFILSFSDFVTGLIKAYCKKKIESAKMRKGGLHKLCNIIVITTACATEFFINRLGIYYHTENLGEIIGTFTSVSIFIYIALMEIISLIENYAEITGKKTGFITRLLSTLKENTK